MNMLIFESYFLRLERSWVVIPLRTVFGPVIRIRNVQLLGVQLLGVHS